MNTTRPGPRGRDTATGPSLVLVQASPRAQAWLFALVVVLPLVLVGVVDRSGGGASGAGGTNPVLFALLGVAGFCLLLWAALALLVRRHRLTFDAGGLEVATTFYRRRLALDHLALDAARVVNLDERPELRPMLRTNGLAIPGFRSGWYRLRNGHRALVATAGSPRVLWIPTAAGYDLLLQPVDPLALLERMRAMAAAASRR